jgi:endonuclease I
MKKYLLFIFILLNNFLFAQIPTYYNNVNLTLTGVALKTELSQKITNTHTTLLQYNDVWGVLQQTDLDPSNSNNVLLLYGYNDGDGNPTTDRTRNKNNNGGNVGDWNREHTYAQSLATPSMNTSSPNAGTDAHHLRSTDVQMNGNRGNRKFATGSGNAGNIGANWYPGDEWKGDVARMMMYMYLRYPSQCLPNNVGVGSSIAIDPSMIDLFLQWNADDTVSLYETNRNNILETEQGNRNPFIDNPYLATIIWSGTPAQDNWNMTVIEEKETFNDIAIYPVPSINGDIHVHFKSINKVDFLELHNLNGQKLESFQNLTIQNHEFILKNIKKGFYILKVMIENQLITKKIIAN